MVDADEPLRVLDELESVVSGTGDETNTDNQERNLRTPLRTSGALYDNYLTQHIIHSSFSTASQIDLTMSSSSSNSNSSTTNTVTTAEATYSSKHSLDGSNNSMLPPTTILSSSDPLPDVVFKHNDFSSILVTTITCPNCELTDTNLNESLDEDMAEEATGLIIQVMTQQALHHNQLRLEEDVVVVEVRVVAVEPIRLIVWDAMPALYQKL
ncbi:Supporter of activation of yellow protein [Eumeta japonica]|uniref:Supporter of activation of yellow protein n=1 Tax=Eumeta variegata TaxID=151549 RepID=A0A4C1SL71_EUMVA|nr:Supporter of activation of yellow protein [Eumeta japonica]